jgi:hypothetical protein
MDNPFEALGVAVMVLGAVALVGALIRIVIGIIRVQRARAAAEPANSHPGRVIPPGVPITRALKDAAGDLRESQSQAIWPPPYFILKAFWPFRLGQWLRRKLDGTLVQYFSTTKPGRFWILSAGAVVRSYPALSYDYFEPALPRQDEWWQKRPCPKGHPLPKDTLWEDGPVKWCYTVGDYTSLRCGSSKPRWDALFASERGACECGCLAPVNFGLGEATHHETSER